MEFTLQTNQLILSALNVVPFLNLFSPGGRAMKDAYEILYQKEAALARVRREIDSLTIAARLLVDDISDGHGTTVAQEKKSVRSVTSPEPAASPEAQPFVWPRSGFWSALKLRR